MTGRERRTLLTVLGFLTFSSVYVNIVVTPVLEQLAGEFGVTTGTAGLLVAAYGLPGIAVGLLAGPYSDRLGRKVFLVAGAALMGLFTLLAAFVASFALLLATRFVAGAGAAVIFPNVNATIGDSFPYRERGRAMSTVIGVNTLASVAGLPIAGIVAEATSWRVSMFIVGTLAVLSALMLLLHLRPDRPDAAPQGARVLYSRIVGSRSAIAAIVSSLAGALFWFTWGTYLVVFFQRTFGLSQGVASTVAVTMGLGVFVGSQLGGRLGDRVGHKQIVASTIAIAGLLLFTLTNLPLPLAAAAALNLLLSAVIGARFATNTVLLSEQVPQARGTMLAVSSSVVSLGIVAGASLGGVLVDTLGFWALGAFCLALALLSALIVWLFVTEEPMDLELAPS
ncbi:MAG: MFS transporter [Candidatus Limnocylindria bacterium]